MAVNSLTMNCVSYGICVPCYLGNRHDTKPMQHPITNKSRNVQVVLTQTFILQVDVLSRGRALIRRRSRALRHAVERGVTSHWWQSRLSRSCADAINTSRSLHLNPATPPITFVCCTRPVTASFVYCSAAGLHHLVCTREPSSNQRHN
jgi:hypothetical protein